MISAHSVVFLEMVDHVAAIAGIVDDALDGVAVQFLRGPS
jgi:hypothetical protein